MLLVVFRLHACQERAHGALRVHILPRYEVNYFLSKGVNFFFKNSMKHFGEAAAVGRIEMGQ
jgi:hypothetical protein